MDSGLSTVSERAGRVAWIIGRWVGLGLVFATVFDAPKQAIKVILVLCIASSAGYFGVKFLYQYIPGIVGALFCGAAYGSVMGTGLGYALYACQEPARQRLKTLSTSDATVSASRRCS